MIICSIIQGKGIVQPLSRLQESRAIAFLSQDPAMLDLYKNGCGDMHSLVAKMSFPDKVGDTPIKEIKKKFHDVRNDAKGVEFAINPFI